MDTVLYVGEGEMNAELLQDSGVCASYRYACPDLVTLSAAGTAIVTLAFGWALWQQNASVWRARSGKSVSVDAISYPCAFYAVFLIYGIYHGSAAAIFNGMLAFLHVPILAGLWRFKGFTRGEIVRFSCFLAMVPAMALLPFWFRLADWLLLLFSLGVIWSDTMQMLELWNARTAGALNIRLPFVAFCSSALWSTYAAAADDMVLLFIALCTLLPNAATMLLWLGKVRVPDSPTIRQ
jgi:hypothetical protein